MPGHASLAYFFFFGSMVFVVAAVSGASSGCGRIGTDGAMSTSGAGFGSVRPRREASADENMREVAPPPAVWSGPANKIW